MKRKKLATLALLAASVGTGVAASSAVAATAVPAPSPAVLQQSLEKGTVGTNGFQEGCLNSICTHG